MKSFLSPRQDKSCGVTKETPGGCWGVYPYSEIGWDGGTGPGVELQDWSSPCCRRNHNWQGYPAGMESKKLNGSPTANDLACTLKEADKVKTTDKNGIEKKAGTELSLPTRYVMELDSDWGPPAPGKKKNIEANSSIYKDVELHPGIYKIMVWYNGRRASPRMSPVKLKIAADDNRRLQLAVLHHFIEGKPKAMAVSKPDPADACQRPIFLRFQATSPFGVNDRKLASGMRFAGFSLRTSVSSRASGQQHSPLPSFLCSSQESSRRGSRAAGEPFQPKDLGWKIIAP